MYWIQDIAVSYVAQTLFKTANIKDFTENPNLISLEKLEDLMTGYMCSCALTIS